MSDHIIVRSGVAVGEIVLNRPDKHNAMTPAMAVMLTEAVDRLNADKDVRVVLLRGAGERAFCTGSDLQALDEYDGAFHFRNRLDYSTAIRALRKPCIAALKGWVLGGGLELALSADIRVAARSSRFGAPEVGHGWVGAGGASQLLPRLVGYGRAMLLLLDGRPIDSGQAAAWGLIEKLVDDGTEVDEARALAEHIAGHSSVATQTVKAAVRQALSSSLEAGLRYENEVMALAFALGNDRAARESFKAKKEGGADE